VLKVNWKLEIPHILMVIGMFVAAGLLWQSAPDKFPVHWNLEGEVDRYGSKVEGLLMLPLMTAGLYLLLLFVPYIDPKKMNYKSFGSIYDLIRFGTTLLMVIVYGAAASSAFGYSVDIGLVVGISVGVFFIIIGNFIGKIRPNWFVGIRTPWTLSSRLSWDKTHQAGGWWFVLSGTGILSLGFVRSSYLLIGVLVLALGGAAVVTWYSYHVWKNDTDRIPALEGQPASEKEIEEAELQEEHEKNSAET